MSGASVAFRLARRGGRATLYQLPQLDEVAWRFDAGPAPIDRLVGFAADDDLVYGITTGRALVALDLTSGRTRVLDTAVAVATLGPQGTPFFVRASGAVGRVDRRTVSLLPESLPEPPTDLWVGARSRILARLPADTGQRLVAFSGGQPAVWRTLPRGRVAVAAWGDAVAIGTDSGVAWLDPASLEVAAFSRLPDTVAQVTFSPSAHRLYALLRRGDLIQFDRFDRTVLERMELGGPASDARTDPLGRYLLVRPAAGDSVWIVDVTSWTLLGPVAARWEPDLPTVAPNGTVLVRRETSVVAFDPLRLRAMGEATDRAGDRWLVARWDPRRPALELARETTTQAAEPTGDQIVYIQISSTSNESWAHDAAQNLRRAGMNAQVLPPEAVGDPYRVVLGPFSSRDAAEAIRSRLQMPSWILVRDTTRQTP